MHLSVANEADDRSNKKLCVRVSFESGNGLYISTISLIIPLLFRKLLISLAERIVNHVSGVIKPSNACSFKNSTDLL